MPLLLVPEKHLRQTLWGQFPLSVVPEETNDDVHNGNILLGQAVGDVKDSKELLEKEGLLKV